MSGTLNDRTARREREWLLESVLRGKNILLDGHCHWFTQASQAGPEFQLKRLICSGKCGVPEIQSPCSEFQPEFKINFSWIQAVTEFS